MMSLFKALGFMLAVVFIYFVTHKGVHSEPQLFTNTWAIRTDSEESAKRIAKRHNFIYRGKIGGLKGYYSLEQKSVPKRRRRSTDRHTLSLSLDPAIYWSQQQRVLKRTKRGFIKDPYFKEQWYLENTGQGYDINVLPVWKRGITGKGVVVTIVDDGIEHTHPDLKKNYDKKGSYDFNGQDHDPSPRYTGKNWNKHGTRCAGEVAGEANNGVCGVGVAYNAGIGGIRMLDGDVTDSVEASSLSWASDHIHIYSSSWGPADKGLKVDGPGVLAKKALRDGVRKGRNGLGSIFVWATGNGGDEGDYCNCDGYITSIYTVSIGAVNDKGKSPWYAEACPSTLAVTYSSGRKDRNINKKITTTDLHHSCTKLHTGTSAAAPLAAGIFALMLEANPSLTWRDLQHLIVNTSKMTDENDSEWQVNSAGKHVNNKYGFGVLDANALVNQATSPHWETAPEQHMCREDELHTHNRRIPARGKFRSVIKTNGCVHSPFSCVTSLEHVTVYVSLQHDRRGTLEINLISPTGTKSKLLGLRRLDFSSKAFSNWPFMTVFHWGEDPRGTWTLEVNSKGDFTGTFKRWSLRLYGTCVHPTDRTKTLNERSICERYCKKGCPETFSKFCLGCSHKCDCTTGQCTKRCNRNLETDESRKQCSNISQVEEQPAGNTAENTVRTSSTGKRFPRYGQWLLVAAGVAVTFGIIAGVWQGWLYYKTRKKLMRARNQEDQANRYNKVSRNTVVGQAVQYVNQYSKVSHNTLLDQDLEHARLGSV